MSISFPSPFFLPVSGLSIHYNHSHSSSEIFPVWISTKKVKREDNVVISSFFFFKIRYIFENLLHVVVDLIDHDYFLAFDDEHGGRGSKVKTDDNLKLTGEFTDA